MHLYNAATENIKVENMNVLLAALDLGSNSFRLSTGRIVNESGSTKVITTKKLKETVRLAAGLDENNILNEAAILRGLNVLNEYARYLRTAKPTHIKAVATNALRLACNINTVLQRFEAALGYPIEVISGEQEARLIFKGVNHDLPPSPNNRLVIDIGGGSTELIIGKNSHPALLNSLPVGCVTYTQLFFANGTITQSAMDLAIATAKSELATIVSDYKNSGWQEAYGSSGTAKGLLAVLKEGGMSKQGITLAGLHTLRNKLVHDGRVIIAELPGLKPDRAVVLAAGTSIMIAMFEALGISHMHAGEGALRLGVMCELASKV